MASFLLETKTASVGERMKQKKDVMQGTLALMILKPWMCWGRSMVTASPGDIQHELWKFPR